MVVDYVILNSAAFVMEDRELVGSGFFAHIIEADVSFTYFITATHVIWETWRDQHAALPLEGQVDLRINLMRGGTRDIPIMRSKWITHEDLHSVDLCAVLLDERAHGIHSDGDVGVLNIANLAASASSSLTPPIQMMLGDEVFIPGAFWPRLGEKKNIPIVRKGSIAALPEEPIDYFSPKQAAYLVETRSLGGISGSPVWFDPNTRFGKSGHAWGPGTMTNSVTGKTSLPTYIVPYRFVGMVVGTWHSRSTADFAAGAPAGITLDSDLNTGISVVIPDERILEFLMSPPLKQNRDQARANGYESH